MGTGGHATCGTPPAVMSLFQAVILGVVQGVTEFLPISSTAHLIVIPWLLGWDDGGRMPGPSSAATWDGRAAYAKDHPEDEWDETDGATSWG